MRKTEKNALLEIADVRINKHIMRYTDGIDSTTKKREHDLWNRFYELCAALPEDDQKVVEEIDMIRINRISEQYQNMYYSGFKDGIRAAHLFREMEEKPLNA